MSDIEWGDPIEVNGVRPDWLRADDVCDVKTVSGWFSSGDTKPSDVHPYYWVWCHKEGDVCIEAIRLPVSHAYYTVQRHNAEHGTNFKYWPGGGLAPDDWDGSVLLREGATDSTGFSNFIWTATGNSEDIIGYTAKSDDGPASSTQVGGCHYTDLTIQPMEYSMANGLDALQHTIIKYVTRFRAKDGVVDLEKARHCIDMLIEWEEKND